MSDGEIRDAADQEVLRAAWAEAAALARRLDGTSVRRLSVAVGDVTIEIELGPTPGPPPAQDWQPRSSSFALGAGPGLGIAPEARAASGAFQFDQGEQDRRVPVLAPLVGSFYAAAEPGAAPFVSVGDTVEVGQTLCIVEAMKLMNEVSATEAGRIAEICVENATPVEFDQVLMYIEPV